MNKQLFLTCLYMSSLSLAMAQKGNQANYPLVIEFHSVCCGVPDAAPLTSYIRSFKKQQKIKKISADRIGPMGREGEYYLAFSLKELSKKQTTTFITGIKKVVPRLKNRGNAVYNENVTIEKTALPGTATVIKKVF